MQQQQDQTANSGILSGDEPIDPSSIMNDLKEEDAPGDDEEADITDQERELLDNAGAAEPGDDEDLLAEARLDNKDDEGEPLNENIDLTGDDLDVPGSETDDENETIGEEDEENNSYSLSDQEDTEEPGL